MSAAVADLPGLGCFITVNDHEIMLDGARALRPGDQRYRQALEQLALIADETGTDLMAEVGELAMFPTARKAMTDFLAEFGFSDDDARSARCVYRKARSAGSSDPVLPSA
jgi:hypothetical protein